MINATYHAFAPVYEGWGVRPGRDDGKANDFVSAFRLYEDRNDALKYADANRGNFPYCTTGRVAMVKITIEEIQT